MTHPYPRKTRELHNHHFNSTIWNDFDFRGDDIIIATYAKSGTTWVQQILGQLIFNGQEGLAVAEMSPWIDLRVPPKEVKLPEVEAQTHRQFLKTHLPVDALVFSPEAKYIYIGRDGRDVVWSLHNHHANANALWYQALNDTPGRVGPPIEAAARMTSGPTSMPGWRRTGIRSGRFGRTSESWWADTRSAERPVDPLRQAEGATCPVKFAGSQSSSARRSTRPDGDSILEHCSFDYMKANATASVPLGGAFWDGGAETFVHKGVNGRWRETLTANNSAAYEQKAVAELGPECAEWLKTGRLN